MTRQELDAARCVHIEQDAMPEALHEGGACALLFLHVALLKAGRKAMEAMSTTDVVEWLAMKSFSRRVQDAFEGEGNWNLRQCLVEIKKPRDVS